jgi:hypothetical protein
MRSLHRNHKGEPVERTFSKEVRGDNFAGIADETNKHLLIDDEPEEENDEEDTADEVKLAEGERFGSF